ncbi:hypothetical protein [Desertimonas flava]|uniref:hypothetical protein n=1 Tax=Desertimonas flava TaxID=2064846 RepID=UPI000E345028|nr:hypothetical protein [Desertimonas flava]
MERFTKILTVVLVAAVVVSVVHYVDNTIRYDQFVSDDPNVVTRLIKRPVVPLAWVAYTAALIWAVRQYRARRYDRAALGFAAYSGSGIVGLLHFTDVSPSEFDAFQLTHVIADIVLGIAVLACAAWLAFHSQPSRTPAIDPS